ncbi:MAG: DUF3209 family protein [Planctomycetota bacterium]
MACHEIAALRLGLMDLLGIDDESERQHELAELGEAASTPGPLASMLAAKNLAELRTQFAASLSDLEGRVANLDAQSPNMPYLRSLLILTRKVEMELVRSEHSFKGLFRDLEEMHDFVHELFPTSD